eukprot:m.65714 g.65714  ORF g.65714 m.65714 type:complete len:850 (-) comp16512_c0_seq1:60-2609(-)
MASAIRKTANALSSEGELKNLYDDLKEDARCLEAYLKSREASLKSIATWTDKKGEEAAIKEFLDQLALCDADSLAIERGFNDQFRLFAKLWKGILAEKKDLNTKMAGLKKARANTEDARRKVFKAEEKDPKDTEKLDKAKAKLTEAELYEKEAQAAVDQKLFEVQVDKHQTLRTGYGQLYSAQMTRLKELALVQEKIRNLVNKFPTVKSRNEDGSFEYEPFTSGELGRPAWNQGEQLLAELQQIKKNHSNELQKLQKEHANKLGELAKKHEDFDSRKSETFSSEITSVQARHAAQLEELAEAHQKQLEAAESKFNNMEKELQQQLASLDKERKELKEKVETQKKEIMKRMAEETRLEEEIENKKQELVSRGIQHAEQSISRVMGALSVSCVAHFLERAADLKASADNMQQLVESDASETTYDDAVFDFATSVTDTVLSGVGAAKSSRAENSFELLDMLKDLEGKACEVLNAKKLALQRRATLSSEGGFSDAASVVSVEDKPRWIALYDHQAKTQQGFNLVGFKKGDILELIKKREDGWSKVRAGDSEGWAPTSYMAEEAPKARTSQPTVGLGAAASKSPFMALEQHVDTLCDFVRAMDARDKALAQGDVKVDTLSTRVSAAQQSIRDALSRISEMSTASQEKDKDRALEVNQKVLAQAKKMLEKLQQLIDLAEKMRTNMYSSKGRQSDDDFNSKHLSWLKGVADSTDATTQGCPMLSEALHAVVNGKGKHEELQVAASNMAASVAQVAAQSKTKQMPAGDKTQENIAATADSLIKTSHDLATAVRESQDFSLANVMMSNYEGLTENEAKRLIMATQVQVLKLEKELDAEREKLGRLRRLNYAEMRQSVA